MDCCSRGTKYLKWKDPPRVRCPGWYLKLWALPWEGSLHIKRVKWCPWCGQPAWKHEHEPTHTNQGKNKTTTQD